MKSQRGSPDVGGGPPHGNPSVKADTDDHILIETNVPIRGFISHILCHTLAALICICPFIFFPPLSLSPPRPRLPLFSLSLCISLSSLLLGESFHHYPRAVSCRQTANVQRCPQTLQRAGSCHTLIASFKSQISQDQLEINT